MFFEGGLAVLLVFEAKWIGGEGLKDYLKVEGERGKSKGVSR